MHNPFRLEDRFLRAIGMVTVNFVHMEHIIATAFGISLGNAEIAFALSEQKVSLRVMLELLEISFRSQTKDPVLLKQFDRAIQKIIQCEEKRNQIIHSFWTMDDDRARAVMSKSRFKKGKGLQGHAQPMTTKEILAVANSIFEAGYELLLVIAPLLSEKHKNSSLVQPPANTTPHQSLPSGSMDANTST